jgi:hypothetical protein
MNEFEYYLIGSDNTPSVPSLKQGDGVSTLFLLDEEPIELPAEPLELWFRKPIPRKPLMVDFHSLPSPVFSQKIANVLLPMNIEGFQLVPATVVGNNNIEYKNYWVVYVYKKISCLDMEHSEYEISPLDGKVINIRKFFLDTAKLAEIPLEKRLVFLMKEDRAKRIYHKSVVDAIMATNPVGVRFYPIKEWREGIQFD